MAGLIDGKAVSVKIIEEIRAEIEQERLKVGLAVVIVGGDPASRVYVNNKKKACEACGIISFEYALPEDVTQEELLQLVDALNRDPKINGILVQQPLPRHIDVFAVNEAIDPDKDVDGFTSVNIGRLVSGGGKLLPCTPAGIMELLKHEGVEIAGKECVVIGRSDIVGKPAALLMLHANATVTVCHSRTQGLAEVCRRADILISAVGMSRFVTADMVKPGAVVIDVGINRNEDGKLCGDVDFAAVSEKAGLITPVPGGVGPMTIAMLMKNTLKAKRAQDSV